MADEPPLRPLELLGTLASHGVDLVVIGGFSLAAHGYVRGTKDLDVVPEPSPANLDRLMTALVELDAEPLSLGEFKAEEMLELTAENLRGGGNWLLRTRLGRLDVMQFVEGVESYEQLRDGAVIFSGISGLDQPIPFAGYDDLIVMKKTSGRDEDLRDIAELQRRRGSGGAAHGLR